LLSGAYRKEFDMFGEQGFALLPPLFRIELIPAANPFIFLFSDGLEETCFKYVPERCSSGGVSVLYTKDALGLLFCAV
jgi:hypothetical protein